MNREVLKWIAAAGAAALVTGLKAYVPALQSGSTMVDASTGMAVIMVATRSMSWLVSKLPDPAAKTA